MNIQEAQNKLVKLDTYFKENKFTGNFHIQVNFFKGGCSKIECRIKVTDKIEMIEIKDYSERGFNG